MTKAVAYYRMSTDKQEHSIDRQRAQVRAYAARQGYDLAHEYADEGIAGDEFDRRTDFLRMLKAAAAGGFAVIVVDEPSRLSRQDPIDFIVKVVEPLRRAGVKVDTASNGLLDYQSLAGLILSVVKADQSSGESKNMSRRVLTRLIAKALSGAWQGIVPYGYRARGHGKDRRLVEGPEEEVRVVRWVYEAVGRRGMTLGEVCAELAARGVPPPRGNGVGANKARGACGLWSPSTLRRLVRRRTYCGDLVWNNATQAKHYEVKGGQVVATVGRDGKRWRRHGGEDLIVVPDVIPPLVDRDTWRLAQEALGRNRTMTSPKKPGERRHLFTHLLVCGSCGGHMVGGTKKDGRRYYICSTYQRHRNAGCHANTVREDVILDRLVEVLQREYLDPARLEELRVEMKAQLRGLLDAGEAARLRKLARKLSGQVERGNRNLALLPADRLPGVVAQIRAWEQERDKALARLDDLGRGEARIAEALAAAERHLWRLRDGLLGGDPQLVKSVIREAVAKVELRFEHDRRGKLVRRRFCGGTIYLRCELASSHLGPMGC
jgi:DNA invertase Pin-like site-specific DNA recombinase